MRESYDLIRSGWVNFLALYFFAEEKAVLQLQNELMDFMGDLIQRVAPNPEMVNRIWSKTGPRSALRGLIIEGFVYEFYAATVLRCHKYDNTQFLQDLMHYYQDISAPITNQARKPFMVPCRYHVHEAGDPQDHSVFARAKFGMLRSNPPPGPTVADIRFNGIEHFGCTGPIPSFPDTGPSPNVLRGPMVADESESRFNGIGQFDNTRSIPSIYTTGPESNTPQPPMIAEVIESLSNGTGQCEHTGTIPSVPDTGPEPNVPRGPMVEEEFESLFNGTGHFDNVGTIPFVNASTKSRVPRGPMVEEQPGSHFNGTGRFDTPRSIPSNPDAWSPGCDRQMC